MIIVQIHSSKMLDYYFGGLTTSVETWNGTEKTCLPDDFCKTIGYLIWFFFCGYLLFNNKSHVWSDEFSTKPLVTVLKFGFLTNYYHYVTLEPLNKEVSFQSYTVEQLELHNSRRIMGIYPGNQTVPLFAQAKHLRIPCTRMFTVELVDIPGL